MTAFWKPMAGAPSEIGSRILYMTRYGEVGHAMLGEYEDSPHDPVWWDEHRDDEACPMWWSDPLPMSATGDAAQEERRDAIAALGRGTATADRSEPT